MGRQICLKEWVNGNEISISIDDNLINKFRADIIVFHSPEELDEGDFTEVGGCRCPSHMAELILKAKKIADEKKGTITPFHSRILMLGESLEDQDNGKE